MAIVLADAIFSFDNLREKEVSAPDQTGVACFKNSWGILVENRCYKQQGKKRTIQYRVKIIKRKCTSLLVPQRNTIVDQHIFSTRYVLGITRGTGNTEMIKTGPAFQNCKL